MTTEKTIAEEMTAAGQAWALTSGEPSCSSGDVAVVREAIVGGKSLTFLSSDGNYFNRLKDGYCLDDIVEPALSALARVEAKLGRLNRECNQRFAQALENGQAANDAIHARDRAIDEKHLAVRDLNGVRGELAALKAAQEPSGAEIANYREREAGLIKRAEASDRLTELLPAQNAKLREELVALRKDLRFGDADAQNLAALTEEQARTIDYLHRRLADKEAPEAEDAEPAPAAPSGEGDLEEWAGILETLIGLPSRPPTDSVWFGLPQAREFLAALRSHRCSPAPEPCGDMEGVAKAIRSFGEHGGNAASRAWRFFHSWASTIEAHQCGGEREAELRSAQGAEYERLVHDHIERCRFFLRDGYEYDKSDPAAAWEPLMIIYSAARTYHERMVSEPAFAAPQGSREAGELADEYVKKVWATAERSHSRDVALVAEAGLKKVAQLRALGAAPSLDQQKGPLEYLSREDWMRQAENQLRALEEGRCGVGTACSVLRTQIAKIASFAAPQDESREKFYENAYKRERKQTKKLTDGLEGLAEGGCEGGGQCEGADPPDRCPACQAQCVLDWAFPAPQEEQENGGERRPFECSRCELSFPSLESVSNHRCAPQEEQGGAPEPEKAILNTHKAIRESMKPSGPDWEGFGRQILETYFEHECCDIDGADIFEWAKGEGVILETKYNPKVHGEGADANPGDEWFVVAPRAEAPSAPVGLTEEEVHLLRKAEGFLRKHFYGRTADEIKALARHRSAPESGGGNDE